MNKPTQRQYPLEVWSGQFDRSTSTKAQVKETYDGGVCETNYETVFGCCITILGLRDESFPGIVVGFAFPTIHISVLSILDSV